MRLLAPLPSPPRAETGQRFAATQAACTSRARWLKTWSPRQRSRNGLQTWAGAFWPRSPPPPPPSKSVRGASCRPILGTQPCDGVQCVHVGICPSHLLSNSYAPLSVPKSGLSHFPRCKTRRGGVARPCTLFTSRLHTRPHSVTIRFASGSLAIGRTVASATATASDPPQAAIAAALLWELNALPFDHDTTTLLPRPR